MRINRPPEKEQAINVSQVKSGLYDRPGGDSRFRVVVVAMQRG